MTFGTLRSRYPPPSCQREEEEGKSGPKHSTPSPFCPVHRGDERPHMRC